LGSEEFAVRIKIENSKVKSIEYGDGFGVNDRDKLIHLANKTSRIGRSDASLYASLVIGNYNPSRDNMGDVKGTENLRFTASEGKEFESIAYPKYIDTF
jgi:hypothetical protein